MRKFITASLLLVGSLCADIHERIDTLIPALIQVESGGNLQAIGDNGKSWGQLQIQQGVVTDVNRVYKTNYKHKEAFYYYGSVELCLLYLDYWAKRYELNTGKKATYEILAHLWNGGPHAYKATGEKRENLEKYWAKVREQLEKNERS